MSTIRSKGTKLEYFFISKLDAMEIKEYRLNCEDIPGIPDIVFDASSVVIFLDSCFWHGCPKHLRMPETRQDYWINKIKRNRQRDAQITKQLRNDGWTVLRIWEHSIKSERALKYWLGRIKKLTKQY